MDPCMTSTDDRHYHLRSNYVIEDIYPEFDIAYGEDVTISHY